MFKNYFIVAFRNLKRNYLYTIINIMGLTLGLAISLIIALYLYNELTYDTYQKDSERIYRFYKDIDLPYNMRASGPKVNAPLGPYLVKNYPEVISQTRISDDELLKFKLDGSSFEEEIRYADAGFFKIFTLKFKYGNPETALTEPFSLVLTEKTAFKYFGGENPVGEIIVDNHNHNYKVTGVIENVPKNSHLQFNALSSFSSIYSLVEDKSLLEGWGMQYMGFHTYIKVNEGYDIENLRSELPKIAKTYLSDNPDFKYNLSLQPIQKVYLYYGEGGSISRIILFSVIGLLILLIPCINYMNLNTAESIKRLKEVGVRKVIGAFRKQLIQQFLMESILLSLVSLILGITLAEIILPVFNTILSKSLVFDYNGQWVLTAGFVLLALFVGVFAGSYPAFYLSSFNTIDALKGKFVFGTKKAFLRNGSVVIQFAISIFLICCTGIILMQINYSNKSDLGFQKDNIITLSVPRDGNINPVLIKNKLSQIPGIRGVSAASGVPFVYTTFGFFKFDETNTNAFAQIYSTDIDYFDLFDLKLLKGRKFLSENDNEVNNVIVNEKLVKKLDWEEPMGKKFYPSDTDTIEYTVIGVVKNYHMASFHTPIVPSFLVYSNNLKDSTCLAVKYDGKDVGATKRAIEQVCKSTYPDWEYDLRFLDEEIEHEYYEEVKTGYMFIYFAILAIFISSIGLYGMALLVARQRTKEIGIRKIFGSSVIRIVRLLVKQFLLIIGISILIAIPAAWYYSNYWLQSFVYKVENRWLIFILATLGVLFISFITIIYQSAKAALTNPVNTIKYE